MRNLSPNVHSSIPKPWISKLTKSLKKEGEEDYPFEEAWFAYMFAVLADDVYKEDNGLNLPFGFQLYKKSPSTYPNNIFGYKGVCYVIYDGDHPKPQCFVYFAHRGTDPTDIINLLADADIASGKDFIEFMHLYHKLALQFVNETLSELVQKYGDGIVCVYQTGHSLGAAIADLMTVHGFGKSFTIECPGTKPLIADMMARQILPDNALELASTQCFTFLNDVDVINTCNEQVGMVFRLYTPYEYEVSIIPILSSWYLNPNYLRYSLDRHSITKITEYLRENVSTGLTLPRVTNPAGLKNGYIAYLDPSREIYWRGYAKSIWDSDSTKHEKYNNDFEKYFIDFNNTLRNLQKEVHSIVQNTSSSDHSSYLARSEETNCQGIARRIYDSNLNIRQRYHNDFEKYFLDFATALSELIPDIKVVMQENKVETLAQNCTSSTYGALNNLLNMDGPVTSGHLYPSLESSQPKEIPNEIKSISQSETSHIELNSTRENNQSIEESFVIVDKDEDETSHPSDCIIL